MNLTVRLAPPLRHWHHELVRQLSESGHQVSVVVSSQPATSRETSIERTAALECRLHGLQRRYSAIDPRPMPSARSEAADLVLDLTGRPTPGEQSSWHLEFDGFAGEDALVGQLLQGRTPIVAVVDGAGATVAQIRPGTESPGVLACAWEDLLARCITLLVDSIGNKSFSDPYQNTASNQPDDTSQSFQLLRHGIHQIVGAGVYQAYRALYRAPHWRVGWRFVDGPGLIDQPDDRPTNWHILQDDGQRFYADPFPFVHENEKFVFVEDFEHRIGKGVISVVRFDDYGPTGVPTPVLRHDVHLSYPFIFDHDGAVWMIPETSGAGTVELYRATVFPHHWHLETTLLTGTQVSDATLFRHLDMWWMTGTVRDGGSFSDGLHCWHATDLTGPWNAHPANPVLVDIASARPAGRVVSSGGRLVRPAQDCRTRYGGALTVAEITRLDPEGFDQTVIAELHPGTWWPGRRLHTLNRAGNLECIDGSAMAPRFTNRSALRRKHTR